jgi:hypothetical protein
MILFPLFQALLFQVPLLHEFQIYFREMAIEISDFLISWAVAGLTERANFCWINCFQI